MKVTSKPAEQVLRFRRAFTLIEILVVLAIVGILMTMLGAVVGNTMRKAREAATIAVIQKIEGLLDERVKGFERATKSPDFQRIVGKRKLALDADGVTGVSLEVIEAIARKDYFRLNFPQRWEDLGDGEDRNGNGVLDLGEDVNNNGTLDGTNGVPDPIESVTGINLSIVQSQGLVEPGNPVPAASITRDDAESSELLYFMLTKMQIFGSPPVGESDFTSSELRDTDGDGLLEFIDGWGRPLRFYRWPTRLLKPAGPFGYDAVPGNGGTSFVTEYGKVGTNDVGLKVVATGTTYPDWQDMRPIASMLIDGMSPSPAYPATQWDHLSDDPDDPYGLIAAELKRLIAGGIPTAAASFMEPLYPSLDTFHTPLVMSAGPDGELGLFEPNVASDITGDGMVDFGVLAQPRYSVASKPFSLDDTIISAISDNITNRNRRAGKGK